MATKKTTTRDKPAPKKSDAVVAKVAAEEAEASADRAERAESRTKTIEKKAERLLTLDKVGLGKKVNGFVVFLREQSVVGLAIGLVLGTQAKALVDQLIASFINPLVGLLLPGQGTLKDKIFTVQWNGKSAVFGWGAFVVSILTFVVVAAVVYFVFKGLKLDRLDKKKED
jgi:large conductance mechanosensitive channel